MIKRRPAEYMPMSETYSPVLHRVDQAVRWRAVHPDEPIPPPHEILVKYSQPPEELVIGAKRKLEELVSAADVKKGTLNRCRELKALILNNFQFSPAKIERSQEEQD